MDKTLVISIAYQTFWETVSKLGLVILFYGLIIRVIPLLHGRWQRLIVASNLILKFHYILYGYKYLEFYVERVLFGCLVVSTVSSQQEGPGFGPFCVGFVFPRACVGSLWVLRFPPYDGWLDNSVEKDIMALLRTHYHHTCYSVCLQLIFLYR